MSKIKCKLLCYTNSGHIKQVYTGFHLLQRAGVVDLRQEVFRGNPMKIHSGERRAVGFNEPLLVEVNDKIKLSYDVRDFGGIDAEILERVDFYLPGRRG